MEKIKKATRFVKENWRDIAKGAAVLTVCMAVKKMAHENTILRAQRDLYRDLLVRSIANNK